MYLFICSFVCCLLASILVRCLSLTNILFLCYIMCGAPTDNHTIHSSDEESECDSDDLKTAVESFSVTDTLYTTTSQFPSSSVYLSSSSPKEQSKQRGKNEEEEKNDYSYLYDKVSLFLYFYTVI